MFRYYVPVNWGNVLLNYVLNICSQEDSLIFHSYFLSCVVQYFGVCSFKYGKCLKNIMYSVDVLYVLLTINVDIFGFIFNSYNTGNGDSF